MLAKYKLANTHSRVTPFVEGGPSFRAEGNLNLRPVSHYGGTVGVGVETKWRWLKFAPMFRYSRWGDETSSVFSHVSPNQVQLLAFFSF